MLAPIESNPEVFNQYLRLLGTKNLQFVDVYGLDEDLLAFVPRPVIAILLVFPISAKYEEYKTKMDAEYSYTNVANWSKQTIANSCGTMALLHALANNVKQEDLNDAAPFVNKFIETEVNKRPEFLEKCSDLFKIHEQIAGEGVTNLPPDLSQVETHYVCLTLHNNNLVELDGRREGPILRAQNVQSDDLLSLKETIDVINEFIKRETNSNEFSILALTSDL